MDDLAERILDALPQTQCTRCGYPDCAGYARALAGGEANLNQCPPGGAQGIARLSKITGLPPKPLDPAFGIEQPRTVVFIDEDWCIGCTLCVDACPTDAIIGVNKRMHTVTERFCTGCELCLPVCPVDCIIVENASGTHTGWEAWSKKAAQMARNRYAIASVRRSPVAGDTQESLHKQACDAQAVDSTNLTPSTTTPTSNKKQIIEVALQRARARQAVKQAN
jgi:electron transport complex protein RnfB